MPVLSLACHLPHNTPNIPSRYNNEQTTKQTKAINNSYIYIYIYISCKCDTNRAGHFTLDAYASRPVACRSYLINVAYSYHVILIRNPLDTLIFTTDLDCRKIDALVNINLLSSIIRRPLHHLQWQMDSSCGIAQTRGNRGGWFSS